MLIGYESNRETFQKRILDKVQTMNIFTLKKESKKISPGITNYFTFDLKGDDKKDLELSMFDQKFPYKYDVTNKNDIKKYFGIEDESIVLLNCIVVTAWLDIDMWCVLILRQWQYYKLEM